MIKHFGEFIFWLASILLQSFEVPIREVLAEGQDGDCAHHLERCRDEEGNAPGGEISTAEVADEGVEEWHQELCGTAAEVAPPSC